MTPTDPTQVLDLEELARRPDFDWDDAPPDDARSRVPLTTVERDALVAALRDYMNRCDCPGRTLWSERHGIVDTATDAGGE